MDDARSIEYAVVLRLESPEWDDDGRTARSKIASILKRPRMAQGDFPMGPVPVRAWLRGAEAEPEATAATISHSEPRASAAQKLQPCRVLVAASDVLTRKLYNLVFSIISVRQRRPRVGVEHAVGGVLCWDSRDSWKQGVPPDLILCIPVAEGGVRDGQQRQ